MTEKRPTNIKKLTHILKQNIQTKFLKNVQFDYQDEWIESIRTFWKFFPVKFQFRRKKRQIWTSSTVSNRRSSVLPEWMKSSKFFWKNTASFLWKKERIWSHWQFRLNKEPMLSKDPQVFVFFLIIYDYNFFQWQFYNRNSNSSFEKSRVWFKRRLKNMPRLAISIYQASVARTKMESLKRTNYLQVTRETNKLCTLTEVGQPLVL